MRLVERWATLAADLSLPAPSDHLRDELLAAYGQAHRHYHTVAHLEAVLLELDQLCAPDVPPPVARAAAWFHDAVYDPRRADNEVASARLATHRLGAAGCDADTVRSVAALVEATADHVPPPGLVGAAELLDADLAVLASRAGDYAAYVAGVRHEFAHLDDAAFRRGRAAVLGALAGRPRLYHSATGAARFEALARANLARELDALGLG